VLCSLEWVEMQRWSGGMQCMVAVIASSWYLSSFSYMMHGHTYIKYVMYCSSIYHLEDLNFHTA